VSPAVPLSQIAWWVELCEQSRSRPIALVATSPTGDLLVLRAEDAPSDRQLAQLLIHAALRVMHEARVASGAYGPPS
jgi:hypothetical protein